MKTLYLPKLQNFIQIVVAIMTGFITLVVLSALIQIWRKQDWSAGLVFIIAALIITAILWLTVTIVFSFYRIEGDENSFTVRRRQKKQTMSWKDIATLERPWWAFNPAVPVIGIRTKNGAMFCFIAGSNERKIIEELSAINN
ncbi:MAG: hypothetical protein JW841_15615 [Deltaproteobacteria bacterium]|nr:hypothetical protein [Deltaproteobacteria bacterium]